MPPSSAAGAGRLTAAAAAAAAAAAMRSVLGAEPRPGVLLGVTDFCWLTEAGIPTLPASGCGSLAVAHRSNEWIPPGDLTTAIDLTEALVRAYASYATT